jgi:hypothetical protein
MHGIAVLRSGKREPAGSYDDEEEAMTIALTDPEGLPKADTHRQVSVAAGSRTVFPAGQVARDADGKRWARATSPPRSSGATSTSPPPAPVGPRARRIESRFLEGRKTSAVART